MADLAGAHHRWHRGLQRAGRRLLRRGPPCPTRQLAIVVDRAVISAPTIVAPEFERDQISISGDFTGAEAEALADRMG